MKKLLLGVVAASFTLAGCAPEVGSKGWCEDMKEKPKGDWTANEATDFTKHCIFTSED
ncbi:DUF3012 domain-containing protein [Aestuariibacter sp. A3R04]|uniref:DUF3012 domain-containing protein n=1 Tax=Aestuariibacter sp. A3R04 TaxID=2841571 RepID=UPI001C0A4A39|nr:DUF3012 domain-containing protein [Aestuariibacter sp. A3R04]MBU3023968.1 DUF3012 domain-containing protein [Aestuariibacter sp. A3R04]